MDWKLQTETIAIAIEKEFVKEESWLLFFFYLFDMFSQAIRFYKFHSLILRGQMFKRRLWTKKTEIKRLLLCNNFYGEMWVSFWLNTETLFIKEALNNDQWKESNLFCKTILGFLAIALLLRDQTFLHASCWNLNDFFMFIFDVSFRKNKNLI